MKKDIVSFFTSSKFVKKILGDNFVLSNSQINELEQFFDTFTDRDRSNIWRRNIAIWIQHELNDWVNRRLMLKKTTSNSRDFFILMYGEEIGLIHYTKFATSKKELLKTRTDYWINQGCTKEEASEKIKDIQSRTGKCKKGIFNGSVRCIDYWKKHGLSEDEAREKISFLQRRDLEFYISKYGEEEGNYAFNVSKEKRKVTWQNKDRHEHGLKTAPKYYNNNGQEASAIREFLKANDICPTRCCYGPPNRQFTQYIPNLGYRRYDLAVFKDEIKTELDLILEYHGPGHVNFSDYHPALKNVPITLNGKKILHLGTYGAVYENDLIKRNYILNTYPNVIYVVMWFDDLRNKRFKLNELL